MGERVGLVVVVHGCKTFQQQAVSRMMSFRVVISQWLKFHAGTAKRTPVAKFVIQNHESGAVTPMVTFGGAVLVGKVGALVVVIDGR